MENVFIHRLGRKALVAQPLEICERKGIGHPDTICDSVMNQISIDLSLEYQKRFGIVLHHNMDKSLLAAGVAVPDFGGGEVKEPMRFVFGDRATFNVGDDYVPVNQIAIASAKKWFKDKFRFVDPNINVLYQSEIKPGSIALKDIFERKGDFLGANDTSAAVGYAPFTPLEHLLINLESYLNSRGYKKRYPESGEDIKLMGLRRENELSLTVAMAIVDQFISSEDDYFKKRSEIYDSILEFIENNSSFDKFEVGLNALDTRGRGREGLYLTVLGTSAEAGDSGQVGRGNNVVGVIPLNRPMSSEAAAGKNPTSHVGKIYNFLCYRIANEVVERVNGIEEIYVWLLSRIGRPINEPSVVSTQVVTSNGVQIEDVSEEISEVIAFEFDHLKDFCKSLVKGEINVI